MELSAVPSGFQVVAVDVAAVHPVGHPDQPVVRIDHHGAHLHLSRLGLPVDRAQVAQRLGVVDGDLDLASLSVLEPLDTGVEFALVNVDVADVVGRFGQIGQRVFIRVEQFAFHGVAVQRCGTTDPDLSTVGGHALPPLDLEEPFEREARRILTRSRLALVGGLSTRGREQGQSHDPAEWPDLMCTLHRDLSGFRPLTCRKLPYTLSPHR